jgi:hypothetical protein
MKRVFISVLCLCLCLSACKKDKIEHSKNFKGISQTQGGKLASVFEFSSGTNPTKIVYNAVLPYATGTILLKINYQLTYKEKVLSSARIEGMGEPVLVDFTSNVRNLITGSNFYGKRKNITYAYNSQDQLISSSGGDSIYECAYNSQNNLEKIVYRNAQGGKRLEVHFTGDDSSNPLYGSPLPYLEGDMPMWTWFSLSKHNITSLIYTYFDSSGNVTETVKYVYSYTYLNDKPLTMRRYLYSEFLKGDKGYYDGFAYNY